MRRLLFSARLLLFAAVVFGTALVSHGQRHSLGSAPPTAPSVSTPKPAQPAAQPAPIVRQPASGAATHAATASNSHASSSAAAGPVGPIAPISTGLGAIQFFSASYSVPAPQTLTRQLSADDERTRSGALSSIGAPSQYLGKGHVPYPHSVQLDLVLLGESDQIDALLTVELDQHIVTSVMAPDGDNWRRIATVLFATSFGNGSSTPATFVRPLRSWLQPDRYRAVFHAM